MGEKKKDKGVWRWSVGEGRNEREGNQTLNALRYEKGI